MKFKLRFLALLPLLFILFACQTITPTFSPTPTATLAVPTSTETHPPSPSSTFTPIPSLTPTDIPPSPTPTQVSTPSPTSTSIPLSTQLQIFQSLWNIVNDTYVYPDFNGLDWNAIHLEYQQKIESGLSNSNFYLTMDELISSLGDDHSYFLTPQQVADQNAEYQGTYDYAGIGVMVSAVPERQHAVILSVFPGSPAEAAGLQPRDSIISVNGTPIMDSDGTLRDVVRGPEGTTVDITVQTPGEEPREIQITRQRITGDYPIVHSVITTPERKRIGYLFLVTFMDSTVDEQVAQALKEMTLQAPLDGLILDNRMNEGGSSTVLEPMLGYFLEGKLGDFIKHSEHYPLEVKINDINGSAQLPLVVLVGSGTASFGEIFAGILQDTGRAYVIGTTTGGNVEILSGYDFEDGSQLWLANETFRPLNHPDQNWEKSGIIPDLTISGEFDQYSIINDPPVLAAIQYFSKN